MAAHVCSETSTFSLASSRIPFPYDLNNSTITSERISFSYDLNNSDVTSPRIPFPSDLNNFDITSPRILFPSDLKNLDIASPRISFPSDLNNFDSASPRISFPYNINNSNITSPRISFPSDLNNFDIASPRISFPYDLNNSDIRNPRISFPNDLNNSKITSPRISFPSDLNNSDITSPRISFSYNLNNFDTLPPDQCTHHRPDSLLLNPTSDFNFSISHNNYIQQLSSADELFSNGKILPTQIKKPTPTNQIQPNEDSKKKRLKELLIEHGYEEDQDQETDKPSSKSFWRFTRSSSLNCDNGRSKGFIKSLKSLSRSNSTGSAINHKETTIPKMSTKKNLHKETTTFTRSNSSSSGSYYFYDSSSKKPPLKKNCKDYGGGIRINPVLNITHGAVSLFGFGSLFCNGKSKKKRK